MGEAASDARTQKSCRHPAVTNPMSARAKKIEFMMIKTRQDLLADEGRL
jgi:hypothetical protein